MKYNGFELKDTTQVETSEAKFLPVLLGSLSSFQLAGAGRRQFKSIVDPSILFRCSRDKSPLDFEKQVKPMWVGFIGNPTNPPMLRQWRQKYLLLIQEANRRKREAKGNSAEPRSSGRPKKLKFGSLEESEEEEDVTADTKPKTKGNKGSQSKQEKPEKQKPPKETPKGAEKSANAANTTPLRVCLSIHGTETLSISRSLFSRTQPDLARFGEVAVEIY
eukprot:g63831.t1